MTRILVIDDNEINQDLISRRLQKRGFEVEIASDGEEGLAKIRTTSPDIVLLDMSLPKMDGWEVARTSKGDPETQEIPIIALTAHAMQGDREKALAAGCDEYETKPVHFKQLLDKIEKLAA